MRLRLLAFGKLKTPGLREAADHYKKMLGSWVTLEEIELKPLSVPDKSPASRKAIQSKEETLLLERMGERTGKSPVFYLLDETGKAMSTEAWAKLVREWESSGSSELHLCIGSSLGFDEELRRKARGIVSLGPQTLPHELARVVLLEQLYRAWSVVRGHPYHNAGS